MLNIVLVEPEIPNNTGAIARTCAATGAKLHLIKPLGFDISDKAVKRCGLDYWHLVTKAPHSYDEADFTTEDVTLLFGKETAGLPEWLREKYRDRCIRIPMISEARSLNLSNAASILAYEVLRQQGFPGLKNTGSMTVNT